MALSISTEISANLDQEKDLAQTNNTYKQKVIARQIRLAELQQQYNSQFSEAQNWRDSLIADLPQKYSDQLILFQGVVLAADHLSPIEQKHEQAKLLYRKKAVAYLQANHEKIQTFFRQKFIIGGRSKVPQTEVIEAIGEEISYQILLDIPTELRQHLYDQAAQQFHDSHREPGMAIFRLNQVYTPFDIIVDLYSRPSVEKVFGDLLAILSGIGHQQWQTYQAELQQTSQAIDKFKNRPQALPQPEYFGQLHEPFRIFLLQEAMRQQIEEVLSDQPLLSSADLTHYLEQFGHTSENEAVLERFDSIPVSRPRFDKLKGYLGLSSRHTFLAEFRKNIPANLPLNSLYQTICQIQLLAELDRDFAEVLLLELEGHLYKYNQNSLEQVTNQTYLHHKLADLRSQALYHQRQVKIK